MNIPPLYSSLVNQEIGSYLPLTCIFNLSCSFLVRRVIFHLCINSIWRCVFVRWSSMFRREIPCKKFVRAASYWKIIWICCLVQLNGWVSFSLFLFLRDWLDNSTQKNSERNITIKKIIQQHDQAVFSIEFTTWHIRSWEWEMGLLKKLFCRTSPIW